MKLHIRDVTVDDATAIEAIYAPYVTETTISFEETPPSAEEIRCRIRGTQPYPWIVAEAEGRVLGYAYATSFRSRWAYRYTVEVTVYVDTALRGQRIGSRLYQELFQRLKAAGYRLAVAVITTPNPESTAFHMSQGFTYAGTLPAVGFKMGAARDISLYTRSL